MLAEAAGNLSQLCRLLRDVSATDILAMFRNQPLDFILQPANFLLRQRNLALSLSGPNQSSIEGLRGEIGGEQRDGSKSDHLRCPYRSAKMAMIRFLHRHAAGDRQVRLLLKHRRNPLRDYIDPSVDPPDTVMHLARPVDRYDDV